MRIVAKLKMPSAQEMMRDLGLNEGGKVQQYIDNWVYEHSEPYLPGHHIYRDSFTANDFGSGKVKWTTPDTQFLYEGKLMVDPVTLSAWARPGQEKILDPQGRNLKYHGGGKRGKDWVNRFLQDETDNLVRDVTNFVNEMRK